MKKRLILLLVVCGVWTGFADGRVLLLFPHNEQSVKVGLDIAARHESLLVTYKLGAQNTVSLRGWTGTEWVYISVPNYQSGQFFHEGPEKAIVIDGYDSFPDDLLPAEAWCDAVYKISTTRLAPIIHLCGRRLHFEYNDWTWFSDRYGIALEDINPNFHGVRWFNRRLGDVLKNTHAKSDKDEVFWSVIREGHAQTLNEVVLTTESVFEEESMIQEEELLEEVVENPLLEEAPEAVIIDTVSETN
jgi:hypothetical protein